MTTRNVTFLLAVGLPLLAAPAARADLYVANSNSNNVSVSINRPDCGFVNGAVPVGVRPTNVAVSPDGTRAYVTNIGDGTLSVVDTSLPAVVATVPIGGSPFGPIDAAAHPDGSRIYVASSNRVAVVNSATLTVTTNIFVAGFSNDLVIHPDGSRVYVATAAGLSVISTATNAVIANVPLGASLRSVAVHPDGSRLYLAHFVSPGSVTVLDTTTYGVITSVPVVGVPEGMAIHPSGTRLYVANNMNVGGVATPGKFTVIDTSTNAVLGTQDVYANPYGVAVDRTQVYLTTADGGGSQNYIGHLWVFDATTGAFVNVSEAGGIPAGVATFINPLPPPMPANVQVTGIETTQGIQDLANSVTLVAGRRTFVRVHVKAVGASVAGVTMNLFGVGIRCTLTSCEGRPLGGLAPVNATGTHLIVKPNPKRKALDDSFLFELPWSWTERAPLFLYAVPHMTPGPLPTTCRPDAPMVSTGFDFPTTMRVQFIRLAYRRSGSLVSATTQEQSQSESWMRRAYPLSSLVPGADWVVRDDGLATRVDRTAADCTAMKAADQPFCAWNHIVPRLNALKVLARMTPAAHVAYGLIPPLSTGACAGNACFTRGACCVNGVGAGPSRDPDYASHEVGHFLGRDHPVFGAGICGHSPDDPAYPYLGSLIHAFPYDPETGFAGFDAGDPSLTPPAARSALGDVYSPFDIMSYCAPEWISDYTYRALYFALRGLSAAAAASLADAASPDATAPAPPETVGAEPGDWLLVFGNVDPDPAIPARLLTRRVDRVFEVPERTPGSHSIRLIGAAGATLADYAFTPDELEDAKSGDGPPPLGFGHVVPYVAGTREIRIVDVAGGDLVRGVQAVSANPPVVAGVALQGPPDPATGLVTVEWTASDPDGDPVTFDVFFTRDGGASLQPVELGVSGTSVVVDTSPLGGGTAQFRVMATDGVLSAFADTAPSSLPYRRPRPRITTPALGATIYLGQLVNLEGDATDPQDGAVADGGLAWSIPGRPLGSGPRISVTDFPAGAHTVTLTATNSLGLTQTTSVPVVVKEPADPLRSVLTVDPGTIGWHVAAGTSELQTSVLEIGNRGGGALDFVADSSAPWLIVSPAGGTAPATLTLTADPAGLAAGARSEAVVTVRETGVAGQDIAVPVTLSAGNTFATGGGDTGPVDYCPDDADKTHPGTCGCGVPDDESGEACTTGRPGVCSAGVTACGGGTASCLQNVQPSPEVCDGLDNDCDGRIDESPIRRKRRRAACPPVPAPADDRPVARRP